MRDTLQPRAVRDMGARRVFGADETKLVRAEYLANDIAQSQLLFQIPKIGIYCFGKQASAFSAESIKILWFPKFGIFGNTMRFKVVGSRHFLQIIMGRTLLDLLIRLNGNESQICNIVDLLLELCPIKAIPFPILLCFLVGQHELNREDVMDLILGNLLNWGCILPTKVSCGMKA